MKVQIPDQLKTDMPQTTWGKILAATPVVMAVVATMLAGLASSEMTRAQYVRALAAQQQSKAGDQWSFFQAKRLRGALQRNTVDLMTTMSQVRPSTATSIKAGLMKQASTSAEPKAESEKARVEMLGIVDSAAGQQALGYLERAEVPKLSAGPSVEAKLKTALDGLEKLAADSEMAALLAPISDQELEHAVRGARDQAQAFDMLTQPVNRTLDQMNELFARWTASLPSPAPMVDSPGANTLPPLHRDFTAARLAYNAARYEVEARLNQGIANLYELQVRKSNITAQRHHMRSQRFFFGMLAAQLGVIVSTLAMAARKRSLLWSVAAAAGLIAIVFAVYVYLYV
jgi:hypothetical protein